MNARPLASSVGAIATVQFLLAACGSDSEALVSPAQDQLPPHVQVHFPPLVDEQVTGSPTVTDSAILHVRGHAEDESGVRMVRVGGVDAETVDGFLHWTATLQLTIGVNKFAVETEDLVGNSTLKDDAFSVLRVDPFLLGIADADLDAPRGRMIVAEPTSHSLIAVDLDHDSRRVVFDPTTRSVAPFHWPTALGIDESSSAAWVVDSSNGVLVRFDLSTGEAAVTSSSSVGVGPSLEGAVSVVFAAEQNRVFAAIGGSSSSILAINPSNGDRSVLSSDAVGQGEPLGDISDIVIDASRDRVLVLDHVGARVLAVDSRSGDRTMVASEEIGLGPALVQPARGVLDEFGGRLLLVDDGLNALVAVDVRTGDRTILADDSVGRGPALGDFAGVSLDRSNGHVLIAELDRIVRANPATGDREVHSRNERGIGPSLHFPDGLAINAAMDRVLVRDFVPEGNSIFSIDLATGDRELVSDATTGDFEGAGEQFLTHGIAFDESEQYAFVIGRMLDTPMPYLLQYNIGSGSVRPFAGIPMFTHLYDLVLVPAGDQVLMGGNEVLLALDLTSGRTRVVSANTVNGGVGAGPSLEYLWHVAIDPAEGRVITSGFGAFNEVRIGAIDIATGDRRIVADTNTGSGVSLGFPQGLVVDSGRDRALVCDGDSLVGVNLTNGNRTIVSRREGDMVGDASDGAPAVGFGPRFLEPRDVVIDDARDVAYCICGPALRGLLAVDILTGDRLLVSR